MATAPAASRRAAPDSKFGARGSGAGLGAIGDGNKNGAAGAAFGSS